MPTLSFPCQDCSSTFESFHALQEHTAQHKWGPHKIIEGESGKTFVCLHPNCNKVIRSNRKVLRKHLISHQAPTHACAFPGCNRSFHERSKLKRHRLVHSGIKQYKCEHEGCGKTFAYKANMKTHMRTHTGQRPFKCSWPGCDKTFTQASNRSTHMNVHKRLLKRANEEVSSDSEWELNVPAKKPRTEDVSNSQANVETPQKVQSDGEKQQLGVPVGVPVNVCVDAAQLLAQFGSATPTFSPQLLRSMVVPAPQHVKFQTPAKACSPVALNQPMGAGFGGASNVLLGMTGAKPTSPFVVNPEVLSATLARYPLKLPAAKQFPTFQPICTYGPTQPAVWFNQKV